MTKIWLSCFFQEIHQHCKPLWDKMEDLLWRWFITSIYSQILFWKIHLAFRWSKAHAKLFHINWTGELSRIHSSDFSPIGHCRMTRWRTWLSLGHSYNHFPTFLRSMMSHYLRWACLCHGIFRWQEIFTRCIRTILTVFNFEKWGWFFRYQYNFVDLQRESRPNRNQAFFLSLSLPYTH